jgi:3-oxoacyl-[acyl-carrier protein] reductase
MDLGLKGKIAMVGGASKGLGFADAIAAWHEAALQQFGGVDLLFANTGGPPAGSALAFDDRAWQCAFELLLMSVVRSIRAVVPSMSSRGGGAILVGTSSSVKEPLPNLALSNVLRSGVTSLAKTLSVELAPQKIRVNTIIPGRIATDRLRQLDEINSNRQGLSLPDHQARAAASIPLGRYGAPDDFGRVGAFLLSDAASYITGSSVQVDGGLVKGLL